MTSEGVNRRAVKFKYLGRNKSGVADGTLGVGGGETVASQGGRGQAWNSNGD